MLYKHLLKHKEQEQEEYTNKIYGVVTAQVTNNKDPEKKGRIKVKYTWMGEAKAIESDWARVVSLMAGKDRGLHFLPEVDDEVLVSFEHGNINFPYIVGGLWNSKDTVIETNTDGKNNIKMIKSRSGHTITLDDSDGKEKFSIEDQSGKRSIILDTKTKEITIDNSDSDGKITISSTGDITIDSNKKVSIIAGADLSIKAKGDLTLEGKNVTMKSSAAMTLKSSSSLTAQSGAALTLKAGSTFSLKASGSGSVEALSLGLKGSGTTTVESSGITTLKGSMVKVN